MCSDSPLSQSIYFHDMDGVAACLRAVGGDPCVRVVRVSHKLADGYDAAETAGYRDVSLGLRLRTEAARRLGLHGFVCELQLILVDFARVKVQFAYELYGAVRIRIVRCSFSFYRLSNPRVSFTICS